MLTEKQIKSLKDGRHRDADGLYLRVAGGSRTWQGRYQKANKAHWMGLGPYPLVSVAAARDQWREARVKIARGQDPIICRRVEQQDKSRTFRAAMEAYITDKKAGWRDPTAERNWRWSLAYALPVIGDLHVQAVTVDHVLTILRPLWTGKTETGNKLRQRIECILSYAKAIGWRTGENVAAWRDGLEHVLPAPRKVAPVIHHAAVDWRQAAAFVNKLRRNDDPISAMIEFTILTAVRTAPVQKIKVAHIDLDNAIWTIPAALEKSKREQKVPLSGRALKIIRSQIAANAKPDDLVFCSDRGRDVARSHAAMWRYLQALEIGEATIHGMRATFSTWASETGQRVDVAEAALSHKLGNATYEAYQRGDLLDARRELMETWAAYLDGPQAMKLAA